MENREEENPRNFASKEMIRTVVSAETHGWDPFWINPDECEITKGEKKITIREVKEIVIDE